MTGHRTQASSPLAGQSGATVWFSTVTGAWSRLPWESTGDGLRIPVVRRTEMPEKARCIETIFSSTFSFGIRVFHVSAVMESTASVIHLFGHCGQRGAPISGRRGQAGVIPTPPQLSGAGGSGGTLANFRPCSSLLRPICGSDPLECANTRCQPPHGKS